MRSRARPWRTAAPWAIGLGALGLMLAAWFRPFQPAELQAQTPSPGSPYYSKPPDNAEPSQPGDPFPFPPELVGVDLSKQTADDKHRKSHGCVSCHQNQHDPHFKDTVKLGCTDCHGGNADAFDIQGGHVWPRFPNMWRSSANPQRSYTLLNHESPDFIRFVNPGDFRVAHISCGTINCHSQEVHVNRKQIMATGAMLWGAAAYNNGAVNYKRARHGEAYAMNGAALRLQTVPPPTEHEMLRRGVVPFLDPLPRYENSQPGNVLRIFEPGGRFLIDVGVPEKDDDPGKSRVKLSVRGLGTTNRTDPVWVSLNKARLLDPMLYMLGTNDHPGDYRSSGCTACHVVYANDRSPVTSAQYAKFGNKGLSFQDDPTIPKNESGHPIEHRFRSGIPTSQCIVCHTHPGTTVMNSYPGFMWWDEETNGELLYPPEEKEHSPEEMVRNRMLNPNQADQQSRIIEPEFLADMWETVNPRADKTQFADFHGHGWAYKAVYKKDRAGKLLDYAGRPVEKVSPQTLKAGVDLPVAAKDVYRTGKYKDMVDELLRAEKDFEKSRECQNLPVHLLDIHLEKGMHCVDCHFVQDMHGNGRLHMEVRAACEIQCIDCHGTYRRYTTLRTSGHASYTSAPDGKGRDLAALRTPSGKPRFERLGDKVYQNSMVEPDLRWEVVQTKDTITKGHPRYNEKSDVAKSGRVVNGEFVWGGQIGTGNDKDPDAVPVCHEHTEMSCQACHSSWNPSCYGCHLPQQANLKMPMLHWEGDVSRNYTNYNWQTLREDVFMLGRDGDATGNRINPARSSCAIHVGSYNGNRENIYVQQQTISAEGYSGIAFSTNVPHTVSGKGTTKMCTDCHLSSKNDNNAVVAQLLMHGTGYLNFVGRYAWVACGSHGIQAVVVTERDEPQTVIGSSLHALAFPKRFEEHLKRGKALESFYEHPGRGIGETLLHPLRHAEIHHVQNRGEFLAAACGREGVRVFDIANIDNKGFSERYNTAPFSPVSNRFFIRTKDARFVAAPATTAPDPTRSHLPENKEGRIHPVYRYVYVADKEEGLIVVDGAMSTIDGNPLNNVITRAVTFNPDGLLCGAINVAVLGPAAYVLCDRGIAIVDLNDPLCPKLVRIVGEPAVKKPKVIAAQLRYAYVGDEEGIKVLDITDPLAPKAVAMVRMSEVNSIYFARTYAYVAAGPRGLVIFDIKDPSKPKLDQIFDADGCMNDCKDVQLGITYNSQFAYVADGKNGLRVVQLTSPETPGNDGFSPRPTPKLVATFKIPHEGHALRVARGLDRDRAVDEFGNQVSVFGRVGARPVHQEEQRTMLVGPTGKPWLFSDDPTDEYFRTRYVPPPAKNGDPGNGQ